MGHGGIVKTLLLPVTLFLVLTDAHADFYRYSSSDGVETFTNIPTTPNAVKILREDPLPQENFGDEKKKRRRKKKAEPAVPPSAVLSPAKSLSQPFLPVQGTISSRYGWRHDPIDGNLRHHNGIDIAVKSGTPVKSIATGKVSFSGARGGYGNLVIIEHDDGMVSLYGHNSLLLVTAGELVDTSRAIALSGSTGRSTGPHLHFELWKDGANLTEALVEGRGGSFSAGAVAAKGHQDEIRRFVEKNGTIVFTNLPFNNQ